MTMVSEANLRVRQDAGTERPLMLPTLVAAEALAPPAVAPEVEINTEVAPSEMSPEEAATLTGVPVVCEGDGGRMVRRTTAQILAMAAFRENGYGPGSASFMGEQVHATYVYQAGLRRQTAERRTPATGQKVSEDYIPE